MNFLSQAYQCAKTILIVVARASQPGEYHPRQRIRLPRLVQSHPIHPHQSLSRKIDLAVDANFHMKGPRMLSETASVPDSLVDADLQVKWHYECLVCDGDPVIVFVGRLQHNHVVKVGFWMIFHWKG